MKMTLLRRVVSCAMCAQQLSGGRAHWLDLYVRLTCNTLGKILLKDVERSLRDDVQLVLRLYLCSFKFDIDPSESLEFKVRGTTMPNFPTPHWAHRAQLGRLSGPNNEDSICARLQLPPKKL